MTNNEAFEAWAVENHDMIAFSGLTVDDWRTCWDARGKLAEEERKDAIRDFVHRVNARAEADMLSGNPVTGAHHRAIEAEIAALEERCQ